MQRVTHLSGTLWFGLKSRCWLFGLQDTSRPVKPHLIGLCRLLTILVQAMFTSQGSFLSAKGWCWHSCFCLAVCNLWHSHPDLLFWWPGTWRNGCPSLSTAAGMLGKYSGSPKHSSLFNFVLHGEGGMCSQFCRTFLLCCQEIPAGFSPLDKIRIELFGWHYWFDNEFSYFPTTLFPFLCEEWHLAWLTLALLFLGQTSRDGDCRFIRVHTGWL